MKDVPPAPASRAPEAGHAGHVGQADERLKDLTRAFLGRRHELLAFVQGLVRDRATAEEIVQEVWVRLAGAAGRGEDIRRPEQWCRGVARNLVLHHFRGRRRARVVADSRLVELAELAFEEFGSAGDVWSSRRQWLAECVESLPEKSKEVLRLKYVQGLKAGEIARRQNRSLDAVLKALSRVRQLLAECVERRRARDEGGS